MSLSISEKLKVEIIGHTALITIDNPGANTWDTESLPALKDLVEKLNKEKDVYALVLTGAGEKFFSAGADLTQIPFINTFEQGKVIGRYGHATFKRIMDFPGG